MRRSSLPSLVLLAGLTTLLPHASAQVNGSGHKPYLGWSSFSQQTLDGNFLTQANMIAQSDALKTSGLQEHGFVYINLDSGWQGSFDQNGRPIPNTTTFPDIKALVDHIHANGQKAGLYWIPGIEQPAVDGNYPILGTQYHTQDIVVTPLAKGNAFAGNPPNPYHDKIDFTKPGAQEYIDSVVALFSSWGFDFIKLDAVTPGSYSNDLSIDNRADVEAWSKAIAKTGRPIWLTVSWQLSQDYASVWQQWSNARRIDDDVECEGRCATLTNWPRIVLREYDNVGWQHETGATLGWNDMDTLDVGDGALDGLSDDEKQTAITIWAVASSPMYLGGDLTKLDDFAKSAFTNDELIAVDQSGRPAVQVTGGPQPVWMSKQADGSIYVALYNLNGLPSKITVRWSDLGFRSAIAVRDVWNRIDLGASPAVFTTTILGHGSRLLKVTPFGTVSAPAGRVYEAESATLSGSTYVSQCSACSGGAKLSYLGASPTTNNATFNVYVEEAGTYRMEVDAMTQGPRALVYTVNGSHPATLNMGGGSFNLPQATTVPVTLLAGNNTITFGNPGTYAADLDRIVISGNGNAIPADFTTYEAEAAQLSGTASVGGCSFCSGGAYVGNYGDGSQNAVTFPNVTVAQAGSYQLEIDYTTSGLRTFYISVNDGPATPLEVNGSTFDSPVPVLLPVQLHAGSNKIVIGNPNSGGYAPGLDSITVGPIVGSSNLTAAITNKTGPDLLRVWQLSLTNAGNATAQNAHLNSFMLFPLTAGTGCYAKPLLPTPLPVGSISTGSTRSINMPVVLSPLCHDDDTYHLQAIFSANNGADVGNLTSTETH
ncbi:alpha-galactosidase D [Terriglobus albidus]|uniref:alpha-galactosidase D n=1 Tax=Terriglobus albidus TaxID=1592106 RepID=UPI0021DFBF8A|nr:CBM35 domain-containing protein [Terriglobus albidus]